MTTHAAIRDDWPRGLVKLAVVTERGALRDVFQWPAVMTVRTYQPDTDAGTEGPESDWLNIPEDAARAIYEALAEHFGHTGHDVRALRKDYEAERARVDKFIAQAVGRGEPA